MEVITRASHRIWIIRTLNSSRDLEMLAGNCVHIWLGAPHLLKKGVPSAVGFPHCAGSGEGLFLSLKPYPHKCAEAGARTRDLPVIDSRLYRCTRPALLDQC